MSARVESHRAEVIAAKNKAVQIALEEIGHQAVSHTVVNLSVGHPKVQTGRLRNSITHLVDDDTCYVGTNVEYAPYIEFGTSRGIEPYHFLRNAIANHMNEYQAIVDKYLHG